MPEKTRGGVTSEPSSQSPVQPPRQPPGNQNPPSPTADGNSGNNEAQELERDIRTGEYWLIGVGIAAVLVNILIAAIYYGQLGQMTKATKATQEAAYASCINAKIARSTLQEIRTGEADSHNLAVGSVLQAAAVTRAESAQIEISLAQNTSVITLPTGEAGLGYWVRNVGKTAAIRVNIRAMVVVVNTGMEPTFRYAPHALAERGITNPGDGKPSLEAPAYVRVGMTDEFQKFTPAEISEIEDGTKKRMFFYGRVDYLDIFHVRHWTQYCGWSKTVQQYWMAPKCAAYNRADTNQVVTESSGAPTAIATPEEVVCKKPED